MGSTLTFAQFKADLDAMKGQIEQIQTAAGVIAEDGVTIQTAFSQVEGGWSSPAGETFVDANADLTKAIDAMNSLLTDMVKRMWQTYGNYVEVESANTANVGGDGGTQG